MVSEWMDNGNINQFIGKDQLFNRPMLVRHPANLCRELADIVQLIDVANGLVYLHDLRIVHGDLKGVPVSPKLTSRISYLFTKANILINKGKRACIADFGLLTITGVATGAGARISQVSLASIGSLMPFTPGGTFRWMSPELLDPESFGVPHSEEMYRPTTLSDCYAFGMVTYEVSVCVDEFVVANGQVGYPRSYVGTVLMSRSSQTFLSSLRSCVEFDRRNLREKDTLDSLKICGEYLNNVGWKIIVRGLAWRISFLI